ncbi:MAG: glycosyltransferase family 4 protein [Gemmatimonadetes bacterium]|uniref:Glycosyltransferase family 4 protein n=1 Tax=Candidatus Kutchimonas denitrificans TaxID=3056748 RepID=A0AAE5CCK1_9BACT|nr:glycosyltransferase family 4 protein [Gemmatimonadota bacterium]NIR75750.1 glycosyltransferase family 4 protein [Candidatus Kutchimonas denitrificans]NIS00363.1 glycosyltransferase family 4 protein [Gemmatimonadota bacterium]NIT66022.1 glycosyltransferase family 4 protein [Gemmatimonadota bacterium]NIU53726.1 glycosyltransferase [Gemmatimonadota bacterium]
MRVCYLSADRGISLRKHNGASAHFRSIVRAFTTVGAEVVAVTPSEDGEDSLGVEMVRVPTPQVTEWLLSRTDGSNGVTGPAKRRRSRVAHALGHIWNNAMVERVLGEFLPRYQPDLLFEIYSPFGIAGGVVARRLGIRHILNAHAPLAREGAEYRQQALQEAAAALEHAAFDAAQMVVTNSKELRDELAAAGVPPTKMEVIPNGVDVDLFAPEGPTYRDGLKGKFVVGFVASLRFWHGVGMLLEAFRELAADPRFHLLVVGDGPLARDLHKLADELPGRITHVGAIPLTEVPAYVRAMDVAVAPYPPIEGFYFSPLKVLEYMAAARPVVGSRIGQISELVHEGETGLLVPPGDSAGLAAAIRRLAGDEGLRRRLGTTAAATARREHTWAQRAGRILELAEALPS